MVVPAALAVALAHQGGWDEALFVAVPIAILVGLLWLAQKRAQAEQDAESGPAGHPPPDRAAADRPRRDEP